MRILVTVLTLVVVCESSFLQRWLAAKNARSLDAPVSLENRFRRWRQSRQSTTTVRPVPRTVRPVTVMSHKRFEDFPTSEEIQPSVSADTFI